MYPVLLRIPPLALEVRSYAVMLLVSIAVCHLLGPWLAQRLEAIEPLVTRRVLLWMGIAAFVGGRVQFAGNFWSILGFSRHPVELLAVWNGLHAGGAIVAMMVTSPLILYRFRISPGRFADACIPTIGIGIALARLGCFLAGCCFGAVCHFPWCIRFPRGSPPFDFQVAQHMLDADALGSAPTHPLQLYFVAAGLLISVITLWVYPRRRYSGQVALIGLAIFSSTTAVIEWFRADYYPICLWWGPFSQMEWFALGIAVASIFALLYARGGWIWPSATAAASELRRTP